jgi:hypothetical protein
MYFIHLPPLVTVTKLSIVSLVSPTYLHPSGKRYTLRGIELNPLSFPYTRIRLGLVPYSGKPVKNNKKPGDASEIKNLK